MMPQSEFNRLRAYELARRRQFRPAVQVTSRRSAKHNTTNKVYKDSRVIPQVGLERVFNLPPHMAQ